MISPHPAIVGVNKYEFVTKARQYGNTKMDKKDKIRVLFILVFW